MERRWNSTGNICRQGSLVYLVGLYAVSHQVGDECLINVARAIAGALDRPQDSATRFGGEEFLVLLPRTSCTGARQVAKRMVQGVTDLAIPHATSDVSPVVTICIGVATLLPSAGDTPERLVEQADACLYKAKQAGRNKVVCDCLTDCQPG